MTASTLIYAIRRSGQKLKCLQSMGKQSTFCIVISTIRF